MSVFHYFSKDANKRARFIFDLIAPVYGWIEKYQADKYAENIALLDEEVSIRGKKVLDVGTGTGAWAGMFVKKQAAEVVAVDLSPKMLDEARRNYPQITFLLGDAENLSDIEENSFDIVTASFVLHGVKANRRRKMLEEMKRISRKHVIINDFSGKTEFAVGILEFFERSDFRNFKANFYSELENLFPSVRKVETGDGNGLYFAETA